MVEPSARPWICLNLSGHEWRYRVLGPFLLSVTPLPQGGQREQKDGAWREGGERQQRVMRGGAQEHGGEKGVGVSQRRDMREGWKGQERVL